jgi:AraC-like DNA-binding protein
MAGRIRDALVRPKLSGVFNDAMLGPLNRVRARVGVPPLSSADDYVRRPPLKLVATAEPFEYAHPDWDDSIQLIGPLSYDPAPEKVPDWLTAIDRPIVLVSTSSEFQGDTDVALLALSALADEPVHVVVTFPAGVPEGITVPANATVLEYAPHGMVLDRAACAITHGGMGTTQKALARGVPVCVAPQGRDQFEVARRVEVAGCGTRRLAIVIPIDGFGIVTQDGNQMRLMAGQMTVYEAKRPLRALLEQPWTFALLAFERDAVPLPAHLVQRSIRRVVNLDDGPGAVLADFAASTIRQGRAMRYTSGRIGEAGLHLIAGTLAGSTRPDPRATADAERLRVIEYATTHLADPALSHDRIAMALHMAPRTLHRLFENEPATVTEYIRLQRLEATRRDLTDPRLRHRSIAAIAAHWGFPSQAHFTRAFQARYAMTPSTARQHT